MGDGWIGALIADMIGGIRLLLSKTFLIIIMMSFIFPATSFAAPHKGMMRPRLEGSAAAAIASYWNVAESYWHDMPNCGAVDIEWSSLPSLAAAVTSGCQMFIDPSAWDITPDWQRCPVIVHEDGHLIGYGHTKDPSSVMYGGDGPVWQGYVTPGFIHGCPTS